MATSKDILIVGSKAKTVVSAKGMRSDGELITAISDKVHEMIEGAITRAKENGRSTVRPHDL